MVKSTIILATFVLRCWANVIRNNFDPLDFISRPFPITAFLCVYVYL